MQGIMLRGKCPKHLDVYNRNKVPRLARLRYRGMGPGINFTIQAKVKTEDGIVSFSEDKIVVMGRLGSDHLCCSINRLCRYR